jgi:hypothetical protein
MNMLQTTFPIYFTEILLDIKTRNQKSEIRNQKSEIRNQKSRYLACNAFCFFLSNPKKVAR